MGVGSFDKDKLKKINVVRNQVISSLTQLEHWVAMIYSSAVVQGARASNVPVSGGSWWGITRAERGNYPAP